MHEIGRPSTIRPAVTMDGERIARLQVGRIARKLIDGQLHLVLGRGKIAVREIEISLRAWEFHQVGTIFLWVT